MPTVWITFATEDNLEGDIDYLAQEISGCGWRTRMHPMFPGEDEKIDRLLPAFLGKPEQSDAWILFASPKAMEQGRAERMEGAMRKALATRSVFPTIGLFPNPSTTFLPLTHSVDPYRADWRQQLGTALGCDLTAQASGALPPYVANINVISNGEYSYEFQCRPKMGVWDSFLFAILPEEKRRVAPKIAREASAEEGFSDDAEWYFQVSRRPATPGDGYSVLMQELPTRLAFGKEGMNEVVILELRPKN